MTEVTQADPATDLAAAATTTAAATAPRRRLPALRRPALAAGLLRLARFAVTIVLLVGGIAFGAASYQASLPVPTVRPPGDPVTAGVEAPSAVRELAGAIAANDPDRIRAALPGEPYELLTNEMGNWSFDEVESVVLLGTVAEDELTATELIVRGRNTDGNPLLINLIVHTEGGVVVNIR
jgi:hypothetical protein